MEKKMEAQKQGTGTPVGGPVKEVKKGPVVLKDIYKQFEGESLSRLSTGTSGKSSLIREMVMKLFDDLGKSKLLAAAAYKAVAAHVEGEGGKLDRTFFTGVVRRSFKVEKDGETGRLWIIKP